MKDADLDFSREERIGLAEAVFCAGKSVDQIARILALAAENGQGVLLTRLDPERYRGLPDVRCAVIDYCAGSQTGFFGAVRPVWSTGAVAIVSAGTSDMPVVREAERTLRHAGVEASLIADVGVAGLWRLTERLDEIRSHPRW